MDDIAADGLDDGIGDGLTWSGDVETIITAVIAGSGDVTITRCRLQGAAAAVPCRRGCRFSWKQNAVTLPLDDLTAVSFIFVWLPYPPYR